MAVIYRIDENAYYILYKSKLEKNEVGNKYSIYRTEDFGGDFLDSFRYLSEARKVFNKATREAINFDTELYGKKLINDLSDILIV